MPLTTTQVAAYAAVLDLRTQIVKAARQILAAGGITAIGPGEGNPQLPRSFSTVDFARGGFDPTRKSPLPLNLGGGAYRSSMYSHFTGVLSVANYVPYETDEKGGGAYITETHARELDELCAKELVLFMEPLQPFTAALLPNLDIFAIVPIDPDDRPLTEREVNLAFVRWQITGAIRPTAWPNVA